MCHLHGLILVFQIIFFSPLPPLLLSLQTIKPFLPSIFKKPEFFLSKRLKLAPKGGNFTFLSFLFRITFFVYLRYHGCGGRAVAIFTHQKHTSQLFPALTLLDPSVVSPSPCSSTCCSTQKRHNLLLRQVRRVYM